MKNGQLKPAYNVQISSNNQFIVNYSLHQTTTDTATLKQHVEAFNYSYNFRPEVIVADAGYGSEENYQFLEKNKIEGYVKHNYFDRSQHEKSPDWFKTENLEIKNGKVYCPIGEEMKYIGEATRITKTGYRQKLSKYQAKSCSRCPLRSACHTQKGNRVIDVNLNLRKLKKKAEERLTSEKGIAYRKRRPADVEPIFGNIKHNKNFKRFMLRGLDKVSIETGLLAIAHNLAKAAA